MGVPRLFPYILNHFPNAINHFREGRFHSCVDYMYLDANGLLHQAAQIVYNYGEMKRRLNPYTNLSDKAKRKKVYQLFFDNIIRVTKIISPTKVLYIAIDGPAPLSKQAQQRQRRFVAAKHRMKEQKTTGRDEFDSNCITGDTLVSLSSGIAKRLDSLKENDRLVITLDGKKLCFGSQIDFFDQGKREVVELLFEDGRILKCTPDHQIMTSEGVWIKAKDLIAGKTKVQFGPIGVEDKSDDDEIGWGLKFGKFNLSMLNDREKILAFVRILGYTLTDGSIGLYTRKKTGKKEPCASVTMGVLQDAKEIINDIKFVTGQTPKYKFSQSSSNDLTIGGYKVNLPAKLATAFIESGVTIGKRINQSLKLPPFIEDSMCPKSVIREFLGGYFGGDGHSPGIGGILNTVRGVKVGHSIKKEFLESSQLYFNKMVILLKKIGVSAKVDPSQKILKSKNRYKSNGDYFCTVSISHTLEFATNIGFRYCQPKSLRLEAMACYWRLKETIQKQRHQIVKDAMELHKTQFLTRTDSRDAAIKNFLISNYPVHQYSIPSIQVIRAAIRRDILVKKELNYIRGLNVEKFLKDIGAHKFFKNGHSAGFQSREYLTPTMNLRFISRKNIGKMNVYDISVDSKSTSFLANGIAVHNCISPGTVFMHDLTRFMHYAIRKEMNTYPSWKKLKVYFSPATVPGEGEHICMDFIRSLPEEELKNASHCIFGPDGDLIMLTLAAHIPKMFLFREDQYSVGYYHYLDMGVVRRQLSTTRGLNDSTDDFIVQGFFVGNDFIPKIQMFHLLEEGLEMMVDVYDKTSVNGKFLTINGRLSLIGFRAFIQKLETYEIEYLVKQSYSKIRDRKFINHTLKGHISNKKLDYQAYKKSYYEKAFGDHTPEDIQRMCHDYLKSFIWVLDYYVHGLPSWGWAYRHHYAPLMKDFSQYLNELSDDDFLRVSTFVMGKASKPFVQLLSILPPPSVKLLPTAYRKLMKPNKKLSKLGYYPSEFKIDYEGKFKEYQGIAILQFVDHSHVESAYSKIETKSYIRNQLGSVSLFTYDSEFKAKFTSDMGNILNLHIRKKSLPPQRV